MAIKINLLPREARAGRPGRSAAAVVSRPRAGIGAGAGLITQVLTGVFVLMLLVMGGLGYRAWSAKSDLDTQIKALKAQNDQLKRQLTELNQAERAKIEIQRQIEVIG